MSRIIKFLEYIGSPHRSSNTPQKIHCPFHADANESAKVYPQSDTIHCFTCNKTWTLVSAYAAYFNKSLMQASRAVDTLWPPEENLGYKLAIVNVQDYLNPQPEELKRMVEVLTIEISKLDKPGKYPSLLSAIQRRIKEDPREAMDLMLSMSVSLRRGEQL